MAKKVGIPTSDDAWDDGQLGRDEAHVRVYEQDIEAQLDDALELQPISIRLQKSLIEDFRFIAQLNGIGYQPLMRQILKIFVDCEKKKVLREAAEASQMEQKHRRKAA